jgi:hypothetical protein
MRLARILALALLLAACSSTPPQAEQVKSFAGRWLLDSDASDDVVNQLAGLYRKRDQRDLRYEERVRRELPESLEAASNLQFLREQRQKQSDALVALLAPATELEVQQLPGGTVRLIDNKRGTREVAPERSSSLINGAGSFEVTAEWDGNALTISTEGTNGNGISIDERYAMAGDQLTALFVIRLPRIGKQKFRIRYRRE